jgi:pyruvate/2-oxoglutarate dehydrogenase complex dihydrolipoamide dehydrogenase (E3) component
VRILNGVARFEGPHELAVDENGNVEHLRAEWIVVAERARRAAGDPDRSFHVLSSDDISR